MNPNVNPVTFIKSINPGDIWGGAVGMLVALPAAIAFGVTIYAPLGSSHSAAGALAGVLGTIALGMICALLGSTKGLVTAPSAPAAALLSAFTLSFMTGGGNPNAALPMLLILGLVTGWLQILMGLSKLGKLIQYVPYPVVSGYLSGVGIYIILGQATKLLGAPKDINLGLALISPYWWEWQGLMIGIITIVMMGIWFRGGILHFQIPHYLKKIPAAIIGLSFGMLVYVFLAIFDVGLRSNVGNPMVIGPLVAENSSLWQALTVRWRNFGEMNWSMVEFVFGTGLTLAALLSIDTLKTCIVLDTLTRQRHDSNRELMSQGIGNMFTTVLGGIPGSGAMGATLVNVSAGGNSRKAGFLVGFFSLMALMLMSGAIGWVPVPALAGILMVVGFRMIDWHTLRLARRSATRLDFVVTLVVIITANTLGLITASAMGIALSAMLFIREQTRTSVVHRKARGDQIFSNRVRTQDEMAALSKYGEKTSVVELQGALFFGTAFQLSAQLDEDINRCDYVVLDFRRVQALDISAVHVLQQLAQRMAERKGFLIFSRLPRHLPSGLDVEDYLDQLGMVQNPFDDSNPLRVFPEQKEALEWIENRILRDHPVTLPSNKPLELREMEIFSKRKEKTLAALEACMSDRYYPAGTLIFQQGDKGDELFLIRQGNVRIVLPMAEGKYHHVGTFGRGAFFGEMAFLEAAAIRSANAVAESDVYLYVLTRKSFDTLMDIHKKLSLNLMEGIADVLANRLRYTNAELRHLEE